MDKFNRPFPHSTSVRANNSTRVRLGWTFSYICWIFVHPDLDLVLLFVRMRERPIQLHPVEVPMYFNSIQPNAPGFLTHVITITAFCACSLFRMTQSLSVKFMRHTSKVYRTSSQLNGMVYCGWLLVTRLVCLCWTEDKPGVLRKSDAKRRRYCRQGLSLMTTFEICLSAKWKVFNEWKRTISQNFKPFFYDVSIAFNVDWNLKIMI